MKLDQLTNALYTHGVNLQHAHTIKDVHAAGAALCETVKLHHPDVDFNAPQQSTESQQQS